MRLALLFVLLSNTHSRSSDKVLHFPDQFSADNYVLLKADFSSAQDQIAICCWVKETVQNTNPSAWFSFAGSTSTSKEIVLFSDLLDVYLFGESWASSAVERTPNTWSHCCATWTSASQVLKLYVNGVLEAAEQVTTTSRTTRRIMRGGTVVIGQQQGTLGGGFDVGRSFAGELYQLNVFGRAITEDEIEGVYRDGRCSYLNHLLVEDLVLSWEDILEGYRHGEVTLVEPGCDTWNWNWDTLSDFIGQQVTPDLIDHLKTNHPHIHCCAHDKVLSFPKEFNIGNYVRVKPDLTSAKEQFTMCSWVRETKNNQEGSSWFSYATGTQSNELLALDVFNAFYLFGKKVEPRARRGSLMSWHHVCISWEYSTTFIWIYFDGNMENKYRLTYADRRLGHAGTLIIGQEQDKLDGDFSVDQAWAGQVYQLNMWARILSDREVAGLFTRGRCAYMEEGLLQRVLKWEDVVEAEMHGAVSLVAPGGCDNFSWNWGALGDFMGQEVTEGLIAHHRMH